MPDAWSRKDERMYEHIKDSAKSRGKSTKRAKEIAARTVNKERRQEGRTPNKTTQGTGNPRHGLESRTKQELYNRAKELDIDGRSRDGQAGPRAGDPAEGVARQRGAHRGGAQPAIAASAALMSSAPLTCPFSSSAARTACVAWAGE